MKALIIRSPWIDYILEGKKTWEMRKGKVRTRGRIALIKSGSGMIFGTAELADCLAPLTEQELSSTTKFHAIPDDQIADVFARGWSTPWVLQNIEKLSTPIPYEHPNGAVIWVEVPDIGQETATLPTLPEPPKRTVIKAQTSIPLANPAPRLETVTFPSANSAKKFRIDAEKSDELDLAQTEIVSMAINEVENVGYRRGKSTKKFLEYVSPSGKVSYLILTTLKLNNMTIYLDPGLDPEKLRKIDGVNSISDQVSFHSNMSRFPKRLKNGDTETTYGWQAKFSSLSGLKRFLIAFDLAP